jgi:hypothetical protein
MRLTAYPTLFPKLEIRPAPVERTWMNETPERFAYRCLPLNIANSHGWEILCPFSIRARWTGGPSRKDVQVEALEDARVAVGQPGFAGTHFGSGVLTFQTGFLFRTEKNYSLWFSGPTNCPKDGISALTGVVETDWSPFGVTMNWRFTRPDTWVTFRQGEPFCFFFPLKRRLLNDIHPEIQELSSDPELSLKNAEWCRSRAEFLADAHKPGPQAEKGKWQKHYFLGQTIRGETDTETHETRLKLRPFLDQTRPASGKPSCPHMTPSSEAGGPGHASGTPTSGETP